MVKETVPGHPQSPARGAWLSFSGTLERLLNGMIGGLNVTVMVYRAEAFYFADMHGWQSGLVSELTRNYWDRSYTQTHESSLAFASDERVKRFWRDLDAGPLRERFTITIDASISSTELIAIAMERA